MVRILGFVLVALLALAGAAFAAVCPANHVGNNGYTISSPVPALQTSWGKVKTLYR